MRINSSIAKLLVLAEYQRRSIIPKLIMSITLFIVIISTLLYCVRVYYAHQSIVTFYSIVIFFCTWLVNSIFFKNVKSARIDIIDREVKNAHSHDIEIKELEKYFGFRENFF